MPDQDTLPAEEQTLSPEQEQANNDAILKAAETNPNISVDDGTDEEETTTQADETESEDTQAAAEEEHIKKGTWYDNLGPDIRNDPDVTKYKSLEEYIKGNREVRKMIGKDKIVVPGKDATPEERNAFYKKLGRPDEPTGYKLPPVELPEGMPAQDDTQIEQYRQKAYEKGLNNEQFQSLYEMQVEMQKQAFQQEYQKAQSLKASTETSLRREWGAAYDTKIDTAQKAINTFFAGKNLHPVFNVLANDLGFVKGMAEVAEKLGEDAIAGGTRATMTPTEAQKEWDSIVAGRHDLSKAYFDDLNPEHSVAVDRVLTLQRMAMAGGE